MIQDIDNTPTQSFYKEHYFCDYVEILALISNQNIVSVSDVYDRFRESQDINIQEPTEEITAEISDKWSDRIKEWFDNITSRNEDFKDFYPFTTTNNTIKLKDNLTTSHKLYIFLLLSSSQQYISNSLLSSDFENVSLIALKNYLPNQAKSYIFGTTSDRYIGNLERKIRKLAKDLKYKVKVNNYQNNDSGDAGLDLVAWIPFLNDENQNNIQVFLTQCATGKNWKNKQHESEQIQCYIDFKANINYVFFMPYDLRDAQRNFAEEQKIMLQGIFFDRIRILYLLENNIDEIISLDSFDEIVNSSISYEESLV